ncbi:unnamed protein product [Paramecium pentaurelia]|uniref:Uncharacterized protein n=1 Tax=Paramecium pentaurelia TaxID=43138 RepID=A0A8S1YGC3_9CILI|nr:unnamed protein product [Paramecium pentaurelia]
MQDNEEFKNKLQACFKAIDEHIQQSSTNIQSSFEQIKEFQSSDQGQSNQSEILKQNLNQPNTQFITEQFSQLQDDLMEVIKSKL